MSKLFELAYMYKYVHRHVTKNLDCMRKGLLDMMRSINVLTVEKVVCLSIVNQ